MSRLSLDQLTQAHLDQLYDALAALADMVFQFGYETTFRRGKALCDGGLSALESAFSALMFCGCKVNSNGTISVKELLEFIGSRRKTPAFRHGDISRTLFSRFSCIRYLPVV